MKKDIQPLSNDDKELYSCIYKAISSEVSKVEKSFLYIAFKVHTVYKKNLYKIDGCKNIYEWTAKNFKIARGTTCNYINICEVFGSIDENGLCNELLPQYKNFKSSQLIYMLGMDETLRDMITSDMTIKQIREKKKELDKEESVEEDKEDSEEKDKESSFDSDYIEDIIKKFSDVTKIPITKVRNFVKQNNNK